jgi:hypothetical protein
MTNLSYSNIEELKVVDTVDEANVLIKVGWAFLKHFQVWSVKTLPSGGGQVTQDKFLLGHKRLSDSPFARAAPVPSAVSAIEPKQGESVDIISSPKWNATAKGDWIFSDEVPDLVSAIEKSAGGKLLSAGFEYKLSPRESKRFVWRRRAGR